MAARNNTYAVFIQFTEPPSTSLDNIEEQLKTNKIDPNCRNDMYFSLLHFCIPSKLKFDIGRVLDSEEVINSRNDICTIRTKWNSIKWLDLSQVTSAELKTWPRYLAKVYLLCQYGANVNAEDKQGWSVLHACAKSGDLQLTKLLLHFRANPLATCNCSKSLHYKEQSDAKLPAELAFAMNDVMCAILIDKHTLSLKVQCRAALYLNGIISTNSLQSLKIPEHLKLFLNYKHIFPGMVHKIIPFWTISDQQILSLKVAPKEVLDFINKYALPEFIDRHKELLQSKNLTNDISLRQQLIQLIRRLYAEDAFYELSHEEPLVRPPRYSMVPLPPKTNENEIVVEDLRRDNNTPGGDSTKQSVNNGWYYK